VINRREPRERRMAERKFDPEALGFHTAGEDESEEMWSMNDWSLVYNKIYNVWDLECGTPDGPQFKSVRINSQAFGKELLEGMEVWPF
jgi:hypothetical protein